MPFSFPNKKKTLQLDQCEIVYIGLADLKKLIHSYIGETEKNLMLTDTNTLSHCLPLVEDGKYLIDKSQIITLDPGEKEKNIGSLKYLWNKLHQNNASRSSLLINLGGGMITDIGGFAASTFKRGMRFVNVPTSLLGMVDAAIGGKTGANMGSAKNQLGTFALPEAVIICPVFLKTLPEEELISGYAEIVKIALAFDKELWEQIKDIRVQKERSEQLIKILIGGILWQSIQIKVSTVQEDMHDRNIRQGLNFGHSIGHALEAFYQSKGKTLQHGFAVAAGMICEAYISTKLSSLKYRSFQEIEEYIHATFPSIEIKKNDIDDICIMLRHDKKNIRGNFRMSLLEAPGQIKVGMICPEEIIRESLSHYISIT